MGNSSEYIKYAREHAEETIRELEARSHLDTGESLNLLHAYLSLTELFRSRIAAGDLSAHEELKNTMRKALSYAEKCPTPNSAFAAADLDFIRTAICIYLDRFKEALTYCKSCLKHIDNLEEGAFRDNFKEQAIAALRVCEKNAAAAEHPTFASKSSAQQDSYMFAVLHKEQESLLLRPNALYRKLALSSQFAVEEFEAAGVGRHNAHLINFFEILSSAEKAGNFVSLMRNKEKRDADRKEKEEGKKGESFSAGTEEEQYRKRFELNIDALAGQLDFLSKAQEQEPEQEPTVAEEEQNNGFSSLDFARYRMELPKTIAEQFNSLNPEKAAMTPVMHIRFQDEIFKVRIFSCPLHTVLQQRRMRYALPKGESIPDLARGIGAMIESGNDPFKTFRLQLLLLLELVPEPVAVLDESSQQIYPADQAAFLSQCDAVPADHLYSVHASVKNNKVWLHTHGLSRFGLGEIEIADCPGSQFKDCGDLLHTVCALYLEKPEECKAYRPLLSAQLYDNTPVITTLVPWPDALVYLKDSNKGDFAGSFEDRQSEHKIESYCIFVYDTVQNYKAHIFKTLDIFGKKMAQGMALMMPEKENERQRIFAQESFALIKFALKHSADRIITVKAPLSADDGDENSNDLPENLQEYCWFTVLTFEDNDSFTAVLNSEPYYIRGIHAGEALTLSVSDISNWKVLGADSGKVLYTPQSAFLAMREKHQ